MRTEKDVEFLDCYLSVSKKPMGLHSRVDCIFASLSAAPGSNLSIPKKNSNKMLKLLRLVVGIA